ncbi:MAG: hypothetical protein II165_07240 [Bacteroidales bacterium]|nr:hypothetical protein [Bacteroidales bacterium]
MEHNNINLQLLNAVFFLAAAQGKELCLDSEDGNIYEVKARTGNDVTLLPIGGGEGTGNDTPIFNLNPSRLIFRGGLSTYSQNIAIETHRNVFETLSNRTDQRQENADQRQENASNTLSEREEFAPGTTDNAAKTFPVHNCIGVGKVDLPKFSMLYTGETARLAAEVETLLDKIFAATNYPKTIEKTISDYNNAKKYAKNGQVYELKQLVERLKGRINKQGAMAAAMNTMNAQSIAKKKMIFSAVAAVVIVALWLIIGHITHDHKEVPSTRTETEFAELSELDKAIMEWETKTGKKIYPKGRECLAKSTKGMTKDQIIRVIQQNVK